jgi:IclR family acetate operon transcriptional repressor
METAQVAPLVGAERDESTIRSVERALRLLVVAGESAEGIGLVDASRAVQLAPSTVTRMLRTLESSGFVKRRDDGNYVAGAELIRLGALHSSEAPMSRLAQPHLDQLATTTGESCYLAVPLDHEWATYVRMAASSHALRHVGWLGRRIPRAGSAVGAALDGRVGTGGAAIVHAGVEADTTAIAVPVRSNGGIVAAINVVGPSVRMNRATQHDIAGAAVAVATALELAVQVR